MEIFTHLYAPRIRPNSLLCLLVEQCSLNNVISSVFSIYIGSSTLLTLDHCLHVQVTVNYYLKFISLASGQHKSFFHFIRNSRCIIRTSRVFHAA